MNMLIALLLWVLGISLPLESASDWQVRLKPQVANQPVFVDTCGPVRLDTAWPIRDRTGPRAPTKQSRRCGG